MIPLPSWSPSEAKKLAGPGKLFEEGSWFTILCASDAASLAAAKALGDRWQKELGFEVSQSTADEEDLPDTEDDLPGRVKAGGWHATISVWRPGYDDPLAFLTAYVTGSAEGSTGWSNPVYDALIAGAQDVAAFASAPPNPALKDLAEVTRLAAAAKSAPTFDSLETLRRRLLFEAESLLLSEAVVVPLWIPVETGIVRAKTRGLSLSSGARSLLDAHALTGVCRGE